MYYRSHKNTTKGIQCMVPQILYIYVTIYAKIITCRKNIFTLWHTYLFVSGQKMHKSRLNAHTPVYYLTGRQTVKILNGCNC